MNISDIINENFTKGWFQLHHFELLVLSLPCEQQPAIKKIMIGIQAQEYRTRMPKLWYIKMESSQLGRWNCRKVLFSTDPNSQFLYISQDMRQTLLHLLYSLSVVRWDRCVQHSHQILNYLVREHHLYR